VTARRRNRRPAGPPAPDPAPGTDGQGTHGQGTTEPAPRTRRAPQHQRPGDALPSVEQVVQVSTVATAVFVVAAVVSAAVPDPLDIVGVVVSLVLFALGCVAFVVGYARAVRRSRIDELDLPGLFFLVGSVDRRVQRRLVWLLVVQVVVGLTAAAVRPFSPVAFCTLVPIFGLGVMGLCGATHGAFPARTR